MKVVIKFFHEKFKPKKLFSDFGIIGNLRNNQSYPNCHDSIFKDSIFRKMEKFLEKNIRKELFNFFSKRNSL